MIRKIRTGWQVDLQPGGRKGKRVRKNFPTKREAVAYEAQFLVSAVEGQGATPPGEKDPRRLSGLCQLWYDLHGCQLKEGAERLRSLLFVVSGLGDPLAADFTAAMFASYRQKRLQEVSANTCNHEHAYLRAVYGELIRLGHWAGENPLTKLRRLRVKEIELAYLTTDQIEQLLLALQEGRNLDVYHVARLCLATGARWSEAEGVRLSSFQGGRVVFEDTKNGKRRAVPVSADLAQQITHGRQSGRLFGPCYDAFRKAVERSGITLPRGQLTHVLRHTFASYFVQNGGDLLTLQRVLGHSSLVVTMRYAHLAPDHLEQALTINPLSSVPEQASGVPLRVPITGKVT